MRNARRLIAPLLAIGLLGAGHPALAAGHGTMSTCAMFTARDASAVLGGKARRTMHQKLGLFTSCDYAIPTPYRLIITLSATTAGIEKQRHGTTAASMFAANHKAMGKTKTVKRLGDRAFYIPGLHQLWVLKGDVVFNNTGESNGTQLSETTLIKAARLVLKHL
jgi:hypothetical protein